MKKIEQYVPGREIVAVVHPVVRGLDQGFVLKYRDEMKPDDVEFVDPADVVVEVVSGEVKVKNKDKKARDEGESA